MLQQLSTLLYAGALLTSPVAGPNPTPALTNASPPAITIHRRIEEVRINFSVEDSENALKNLSPEAFTVYEDAQPISSYTSFSQDSDLPLRIGLLIDRSDSVRKEFPAQQRAAERFLQAILRPGVDSVFLLDFAHQLHFWQPPAGDPHRLSSEVSALVPGGQTALYDALYNAAHFSVMAADEEQPVRRVIILLSDGEDNDSYHSLAAGLAAAVSADIRIYALTVHAPCNLCQGDAILAALADATGGRAFVLPNLKSLDRVFAEIQEELRSEYAIAFHPLSPGQCGYHALLIKPHDPSLRVRARRGYYACSP